MNQGIEQIDSLETMINKEIPVTRLMTDVLRIVGEEIENRKIAKQLDLSVTAMSQVEVQQLLIEEL